MYPAATGAIIAATYYIINSGEWIDSDCSCAGHIAGTGCGIVGSGNGISARCGLCAKVKWAAAAGQPAFVTSTFEELTGAPPRTFLEWATDHASEFRPNLGTDTI